MGSRDIERHQKPSNQSHSLREDKKEFYQSQHLRENQEQFNQSQSLREDKEDPKTKSTEVGLILINSNQEEEDTKPLLPSSGNRSNGFRCLSARHTLALLAFLGFFNAYTLRVNLSVALVAMVNTTQSGESTSSECPDPNGNSTSVDETAEFDWDEYTQGIVLGAFFYGYITTQVPGGWLASRFGGKNLLGFGLLGTAVLTLLTPLAARTSVYLLIAVRILEGVGEGVIFPAMHAMWGEWAPVLERSKLVAFTYAGSQVGTVFALPISGLLSDSDFLGGWPAVFYFFGALGCLWFMVWMLLVTDTPAQHPRISQEERLYIENSVGKKEEKLATPWKDIFKSPAFLAVCAGHVANNWGFYTLLTNLPTYMKKILKFNMKQNGVLSALPYLVMWIMQNVAGMLADHLRLKGYLSTKVTRRCFNSAGLVLQGLFIILAGYVGCDHILAILCLVASVGLGGLTTGGFMVNHLDIAPKFAGALMGLTNFFATIPGFVSPAIVGYLTNGNNTREQWQIVFYISACVCFSGALIFAAFSQGEEQPWARRRPKDGKDGPLSIQD